MPAGNCIDVTDESCVLTFSTEHELEAMESPNPELYFATVP
jgi:hypothetical protein